MLFVLLACLSLFFTTCSSKVSIGDVLTTNSFSFMDKFCFEKGGTISLFITWGNSQTNQSILILDETHNNNWNELKKLNGCKDKSAVHLFNEKDSVIPSSSTLTANYTYVVETKSPKWIFVASCSSPNNIFILHYDIQFLNSQGYWNLQVSYDQLGIFETDVAFIIVFQLLLFVMVHLYSALKRRGFQTDFIKSLIVCSSLKITFLGCDVIYRYLFARNGLSLLFLQYVGLFFDLTHFVVMLTVLIFLGRGWLNTPKLPINRSLIILISLLTASYLGVFIWSVFSNDPTVLYLYNSTPGYLLIAIRVLCFIWFMLQVVHTTLFENNPLKRRFYHTILIGCGAWIILLPIIVLLTQFVPTYFRERIESTFNQVFDSLIYIGFVVIFRPFTQNKFLRLLEGDLLFSSPLSQILPSGSVS